MTWFYIPPEDMEKLKIKSERIEKAKSIEMTSDGTEIKVKLTIDPKDLALYLPETD